MEIKYSNNIGNYVDITPIKIRFYDIILGNAFSVNIQNDNLSNQCIIECKIYNIDTFSILHHHLITLSDSDYINWDNTPEYIYTFTANFLGIIIS